MKRAWMLGAAAAIVLSVGCSNQKPELTEDFGDLAGVDQKTDKFSRKMLVVGSLDYGQTSASVKYHNPPLYRAFKFGGSAGDAVVVDVTSKRGDSVAWVVNDSFKVIEKNDDSNGTLNSHIETTLTANSDGTSTYYVIFTEYWGDDASFVVTLARRGCTEKIACIVGDHFDGMQCKCVPDQQTCGGIAGLPCPAGQTCIDNPNDSCDPSNGGADCGGICVAKTCGGIAGLPCPAGFDCIDNPNDSCDPNHGGADCGGICVAEQACGGIAGRPCPAGSSCVDNPNDSCDPNHGGADCGGFCVPN